jgi:hypothetical protein
MKNHSLMSLTQLCNAGCKIVMNANELIVIHNGVEAMRGVKNEKNGLWYLPIRQQSKNVDDSQQVKLTANSVYHTSTLAETIKFIHQCIFSPTLETFCKAIDNDQLIGFPPITSNQVRKFLPESTATAKGHMNRTRKGVRSTTKHVQPEYIEADFRPPIDEEANVELFIGATIAEQNEGTIYTDNTGKFPVQSYHGKRIQFVVYEYCSNVIIVKTLRDETDKSMVEAFQEVYEYLTEKGFKPKLNVMDNQCSRAIQKFIKSTGADIQLVNPDDHRVNAAERAIQTWKNHWITGMGNLDPNCPMQLWCQFIEQGQDTLNMLRVSRVNPKLSAYAVLEGQFHFNKTPLAPVGTKALVFLDPTKGHTWQSHTIDAWYVGLAKNITGTIDFSSQTQKDIASLHLQNFSLHIAKCQRLNQVTHSAPGSTRPDQSNAAINKCTN